MKIKAVKILLPLLVFVLNGCSEWPTSPSSGGDVRQSWDPYIVAHIPGGGRTLMPYLEKMIEKGVLRGVRIDAHPPESAQFANWANSRGLDVLVIFPNELVARPDAADIFIQYIRQHPTVTHWEIGNEIELFTYMSVEDYTSAFLNIYEKAKRQFPQIEIIPEAPVGGGNGAVYFGRTLDLGVESLLSHPDPSYRLNVVAFHAYAISSSFFYQGKSQMERLPANTEVWMTETGIHNSGGHINYIQTVYPRIRSLFRTSRIYWYVLAGHGQFSLIDGILEDDGSPIKYSPLFSRLIGE